MKNLIVPAIIAKTQQEMEKRISKVKDCCHVLQLDVMDGRFVPNNSLDFDFKLPQANCIYEAHLMVEEPEEWVEKHYKKVDLIIAHYEALENPQEIIELVKSKGKRISFAINPETGVEKIRPYLDDLDHVLVMTVNPGFYGSKFLPEALDKVRELRKLKPNLDIEVDGGISPATIRQAYDAGANLFVCGSYLQKSENVRAAIKTLKNNF
jgi:ribulose-phosphate 3-epimerase